jgi:hypothetical protein
MAKEHKIKDFGIVLQSTLNILGVDHSSQEEDATGTSKTAQTGGNIVR